MNNLTMNVNLFGNSKDIYDSSSLLSKIIDAFRFEDYMGPNYFYYADLTAGKDFCKHIGPEGYVGHLINDMVWSIQSLIPNKINVNVDDSFFESPPVSWHSYHNIREISGALEHLQDFLNYKGECPNIEYFISEKFSSEKKISSLGKKIIWQPS